MGKRSSRARRREPIRHPIPSARRSAPRPKAGNAGDLTEDHLVNGWDFGAQVRIRQAGPADVPAVRALATLAGVDLDNEVTEAVTAGLAGAALRTGLRAGKDGFTRHMAEQFFLHQGGDQAVAFLHATLVLVAEHQEHGIVGALVAYPPVGVIGQFLRQIDPNGSNPDAGLRVLLGGGTGLVKIKALAVDESARAHGIGAALLARCQQIYVHCGYFIVYGQMPATPGLDSFYRRCGFTVLDPGAGFDPWVVFGIHSYIHPDRGESIFMWNRPARS